jgi:YD repeat-containing protein
MRRSISLLLITITAVTAANAQSKQNQNLLPPPANLVIDGNLNDWGDSLRYHNDEKNLSYSLANDHENLYAVMRINDRSEQARVLNAGITLSIDTRGKKKETFSMTFPLRYPGTPAPAFTGMKDDGGEVTKEERDELMRERITSLRSIKMTGFKDIEGDMITTSNTYGIKTAIDYDDAGNLVYEAAIPLKFFHADDIAKSEWAFNFKINGIQKAEHNAEGGSTQGGGGGRGGMGGGGRGGMGGGGGRGGRGGRGGGGNMSRGGDTGNASRGEIFKSIDFWEKFSLSKN